MTWIVSVMVSLTFRELMATVCSDAATKTGIDNVLRMCVFGNFVGKQIVVDTFHSALYGVGSCQCDVNFLANPPTTAVNLTFFSVNNLQPGRVCNSYVEINIRSTSEQFHCGLIVEHAYSLPTNSYFLLIWRNLLRSSTSGYCLQLETNTSGVSLNITCIQTDRLVITSSASSTTTSISSTGTSTTRTVPYIETTLPTLPDDIDTTTSSSTTSVPGTAISDGEIQTTKSLDTSQNKDDEKDESLTIIVPIVIVGLASVIAPAVFIFVWKRKSQKNSSGRQIQAGEKVTVSDAVYENTRMENEESALCSIWIAIHAVACVC